MSAATSAGTLLRRLDGHDRDLLLRLALITHRRRKTKLAWTAITHLGGVTTSIVASIAPFFVSELAPVGGRALLVVAVSHAIVQLVKRTVGRPRPSVHASALNLVVEPDRFSFPSGHSCAAMAVAFAYAVAFPALAIPLVAVALVVGASRVFLGVHYPGDMLMGQLIAALTGAGCAWFTG